MIEVEKKFILDEEATNKLIGGATFLKEINHIDTYYDTKEHFLTTQDIWLRRRNGKFELKIPLNQGESKSKRTLDRYEEIDDEDQIQSKLKIPKNKSLTEDLKNASFSPFATITTARRKYRKGEFVIDIDSADFGYTIVEVELMVEEYNIKEATKKILEFARKHGLKIAPVRGKLIEYIYRKDQNHYLLLVDRGVV